MDNIVRKNSIDKLISIIVLVYNGEIYLRQCIDSILNQTYKNLEIILVNDCSTDASLLICEDYAKKDRRIIIINHEQNKGIVQGRKTGVQNAKGDYIMFVDDDDWIEPEMCEILMSRAVEKDYDVVFSNFYWVYGDKKYKNRIYTLYENNVDLIVDDNNRKDLTFNDIEDITSVIGGHSLRLVKKNILNKAINQIDNRVLNGEEFFGALSLLQYVKSIAGVNKWLYNYRMRENSTLHHNDLLKGFSKSIEFMRAFNIFCDNFGYGVEYKNLGFNIEFYFNMERYNALQENHKNRYYMNMKNNYEHLRNKNIILYGAGYVGYNYYHNYKDLFNIICCVDKNYLDFDKNIQYFPITVESPDNIKNYDFDYILIAVSDESMYKDIEKELMKRKIDKNKIYWDKPRVATANPL